MTFDPLSTAFVSIEELIFAFVNILHVSNLFFCMGLSVYSLPQNLFSSEKMNVGSSLNSSRALLIHQKDKNTKCSRISTH